MGWYVDEDPDAFHKSVPNEIATLSTVTPADNDVLLIEDASDGYTKKRVLAGSLGGDGGGGGTAAVEFVAAALTSSANTGNTEVAVTVPSGTQVGHTVLAFNYFRNSFDLGPDDTGWERVFIRSLNSATAGYDFGPDADDILGIWVKTFSSSPPSTIDWGVGDNGTDGQRFMLVTVDGFVAIEDTRFLYNVVTAPTVKGTAGGLLICSWGSFFDSNGSWTAPPSDMTERLNGSSGFNDTRVMLATKDLSVTGQTGDKVPTHSAMNQWIITASVTLI